MTNYGYEVSGDYTEVDPGLPALLVFAGTNFRYQLLTDTDGLYAYRSLGADYFDDDFEIKSVFVMTSANKSVTYPYRAFICTLTNAIEDWKVNADANEEQVGVVSYTDATKSYLALAKSISGSTTLGDAIEVETDTSYYIKLTRYPKTTYTLNVYTDSDYSTLLGSSTLTIADTYFMYFFPIQNYGYGASDIASTGHVDYIDINKYRDLVGWAKTLTSIEDRILDYLKAIDNDDFSFNDKNCGTRVVDAESYPVCRLIFLRDDPEFKSYELTSRMYRFLLILETYVSEEDFSDIVATRDWLLQKRMIGAIVDLLDTYREDNPYWSLLTYDVNKDFDEEATIYDAGTVKIYLTLTHES